MRRLSETQQRRVREFVEARIGDDLSVEQLAALMGMSPYHFAHLFKASFGMPPHRFVLQRRIDLAAIALKATAEWPIVDIALSFGFVSQSHFTDVFRRSMGVTPARWRSS